MNLWAMMLDGKHAFHELIDRVAEDEATKQAIYDNNIYQSIADTIVGNQEYMATEKLYDVIHLGGYDLGDFRYTSGQKCFGFLRITR